MFRTIYTIFLQGLATVVPIVVTIYVLVWLGATFESILGGAVRRILPDAWYVPGMGLLLGLTAVFVVGLMLRAWLIRTVWIWFEALLQRLPLVRSVYGALKDLLAFFSSPAGEKAQQVVLVRLPESGGSLLGFVTRRDFSELPAMGGANTLAVYIPMSYQLGGFTVLIPAEQTEPLDMGVEEALRFALTAGVTTQRPNTPQPPANPKSSPQNSVPPN